MRIEILGSGGAMIIPRPLCTCRVCEEARQKNDIPYVRYGPSLFVHDINLLIDTPEEIAVQLNRSRIRKIEAALYSHWHPDHTAGMRIWEINLDPDRLWEYPGHPRCTTIYLPEIVAKSFDEWHDLSSRFAYLERLRIAQRRVVPTGEAFTIGHISVLPFAVAEDYVCAFLLEDGQSRVLICMDELYGWTPPAWLGKLDLAIMPSGLFDVHPLTGRRVIPNDHPILKHEATFVQTLDMLRKLDAGQVIFMHLNEADRLTPAEYEMVARHWNGDGTSGLPPFEFAHDTMIIDVGKG